MLYDIPKSPGRDEEIEYSRARIYAYGSDILAGLVYVFAIGGLVLLLLVCSSCSPAATTPAGATYEAQQSACLALQTHAERRACIDHVRADWATDGGAE